MQFNVSQQGMTKLTKATGDATGNLGDLLKKLVEAGAPLEKKMDGAAKAAFDAFKGQTDEIAGKLTKLTSLFANAQAGMNRSYANGAEQIATETKSKQGTLDFTIKGV